MLTDWFPGWSQHGHYNKQPNDDGLSDQDCVEVRRIYPLPVASARLTATFMWNDRDCSTPNYFICERLQNDEPLEDSWALNCNRTVKLSRDQPKSSISSPGFPRHYPDNANCDIDIIATPGYRIIMDFEELVLENEPRCSYDFIQILEDSIDEPANNSLSSRRLCGDWSSKLKLLRYTSHSSRLKVRFSSDYSHHFGGFKARVSMENVMQCADDRFLMFNSTCYLIVSYPEVTWNTSKQICEGMKSKLVSVLSPEEGIFITSSIRRTHEYRTSAFYWLGAQSNHSSNFQWIDGHPMTYSNWMQSQAPTENSPIRNAGEVTCLSVQWTASPSPTLSSGLYWKVHPCDARGGYICKKQHQPLGSIIDYNKTINGTEGTLTSPNYPNHYFNNLDISMKIIGPEKTRIVVKFIKIDVESQIDCLYDYINLRSLKSRRRADYRGVRLCGSHNEGMDRFNFVSETNEAKLIFHSDYSITGRGFSLVWYAVDVSACPTQSLTAKEGVLVTPNYPDFLLPDLDCTVTIIAPIGKRIWLEFFPGEENLMDVISGTRDFSLELMLGKHIPPLEPFANTGLLTEGSFISTEDKLRLRFRTNDESMSPGFRATYRIINPVQENKVIMLNNYTTGLLFHLNFPGNPPANTDFMQHFIAPLGCTINLELYNMKLSHSDCSERASVLEIIDNYSDANGTIWKLCQDHDAADSSIPSTPIYISSFLNTLHLRQLNGPHGVPLNGSLKVRFDEKFKAKLMGNKEMDVESCTPNPCENGGKCIEKQKRKFCRCVGHFTGLFCALTKCELDPCAFGTCELTDSSYRCHCKAGYVGLTCDQKRRPCEGNPCESRGTCIERGDSFQCQCHAWWEGQRCERRMSHIPFKPLSERMLHEPFWLGLMTVFVVMAVIGLVWCAKRHFPEKIEKLLAEEESRNRSASSLRSSSVREQLAAAASGAAATPSPGPATTPRSLFGRLGIRKPSILSLTSPHASGYEPATSRTFSLDDLLKPPPRRTPSPKKKRNNSTPTKKNVAEKRQILQQLISPKPNSKKVSLGELIQLSELATDGGGIKNDHINNSETKFGENTAHTALLDPKLEKKVTFARLLNKVSAEMTSGSDVELGIMQTNKLGCMFARPASTPPSPSVDIRSPNSTSSNQGSDSFTSSDLAIPSALSPSISDLLINRRHNRLPNGRQKPASADSILAMFRNFSSSSAAANLPSSLKVSPSTTPTASSPQDDIAGDDESSSSSNHTPISFSSGAPESPLAQRRGTIEVSVLDPLSAHKSSPSGSSLLHPPTILLEIPSTINKCLSPIREMPTPLPSPMPSPALTPIMRRSTASSSLDDAEMSDDRISVEIPNISLSSDVDDDDILCTDFAIDPQAEDGLILEEAAAMQLPALFRSKNRPPPVVHKDERNKPSITITVDPPPLVIPTLVIQTPSPTNPKIPSISFPGSPPPHIPKLSSESCFQFPSPKPSRRMLKDFEKPTSLDLPCAPPMITITCNLSEMESDTESISPAIKSSGHLGVSSSGMSYLSPFSMNARGEHTASESNLSSSGYSSMASPGPSRCGSSNPLCPSEMDDQGSSGPHKRQSLTPVLKSTPSPSGCSGLDQNAKEERRGRSDSETLSDDPLVESNDEGIGTDQIDEKIDEGALKSAKELEVFMENDNCKSILDLPIIPMLSTPRLVKCSSLEDPADRLLPPVVANNSKNSLQLPSIVIQCETPGCEKHLSPMSSRSESPLSDRTTGMGRFSPQFYGRHKDLLPFTDSDGLYDFPSSDKVNVTTCSHHKKPGRKREKRLLRNCKTPSPTKPSQNFPLTHLDIPNKESLYKVPPPRKLSPKRRVNRSQVVSSSSSSDSITTKDVRHPSTSPSPETIRWSSPIAWMEDKCSKSAEESCHDIHSINPPLLTKSVDYLKGHNGSHKKVSRLRAISNQIRFLRRLEQSLRKRDRAVSPSDSFDSDVDSPRATSPLLQSTKGPRVEIRKSSSIAKLQSTGTREKYKRDEYVLPQENSLAVLLASNGFSD
ncbi:hypothetical protein JTB14_036854 [Gonioctena quinquepunctata]|nr:hypothetical protein JTB14_036854 [Gonioctena quinquepunctata]